MKAFNNIGSSMAALPILADDVLELHAARLLLLLNICGTKGRISGLTKLAKLDFFVRYPLFFKQVCSYLGVDTAAPNASIESSMIRYHYGPWDQRYYHILGYLAAKQLVRVTKIGKGYDFKLTEEGTEAARLLRAQTSFLGVIVQMKEVKNVLGGRTGSSIKHLIYQVFEKEVGQRPYGETIR